MQQKSILLVEDNADDEALTLRALKKNNIQNRVVVAHDGAGKRKLIDRTAFGTGLYLLHNAPAYIQAIARPNR